MKKKLLLFAMAVLFLLPVALKAQDTVYIGTGSHNLACSRNPTYIKTNYCMTQQLYTATEIGRAGTIYSITFKGWWFSATRNVDIFMVHTNKTSFLNSKDWVPVTTADRVYSGAFAFPGSEITIDLQVPFQYNGTDNLVLVVDDNTGIALGEVFNIECFFSSNFPQVLQICGNDVDYDPTSQINSLNLTGELDFYKNQVWLGFTSTCPPPTNPTVSTISQTSAMLNWTESGNATEWQVCVNGDETNPITVTTNSYTLNGLTPGTDYRVKVRSICGANNTSQWCNEVIINTVPNYPDLVGIGYCTGTSLGLLPSGSDTKYSLSEQIYTAAEIGRPGTISGISFFNNGDTKTRTLDIYLAHTTKSSFLSYDDWVSVTASDWVFSDNVVMKAGEWTSIEFDVPFQYNGTDNLLLVVDDNTNSESSGMDCFTSLTTEYQALSLIGSVNFDPSSPNGHGGSLWDFKNCIQLNFGTVCPKPKNLTASTNHNEVTLTWTSSAPNFNVEYKKTTDTLWQQTSTSGNTITLSGLGNANYEARVKAVCDPGVSESVWDTVTFSIFYIQSNANWYAYVQSSMDKPEWERKFISFSIQNLNTADTASETLYDYPVALTYANGYVWGCFYDYNSSFINLYRAQLHNDTKTIGNFATVKENFENDYIPSMAYNPVDGKIYYLRGDYKLFGFDPSNPEVVTEIGNYTQDFEKITINGSGEAFCFDSFTEELYRISLTDATTTLVGNTPEILNIAFDQATNELFCTKYANTGEMLYWMDTATAQTMEIGFIGDDTTAMFHAMFMIGSTANICYAPENLTISSIGMHDATLQWDADSNASSWVVEYATAPDFSGATSVNVSTNSCQLSGLNSETLYYVRVKVVCSSNSESNWTKGSFHTEICPTADQCAITYKLGDTYGDGWNGCAINVVDVATDIVIGTLTMTTNDGDTLLGTLPVCDGRDIRFEWVNGYYAEETSYTIFSALGDTLFSGSDTMSAPITYTVSCPANPNIVKIGTCNGGGDYLPSNSSSNYSFSQQIYTASEINRTGTISGISFYNAGTTQSRNFDMYIVHTNKSAFDHNLDWISTTPADLVFSGPIELTAGAWTEIALDVPFAYNGTDNLLLVMNDKTGNSATGMSCYTFQTSAIEAIYGYRDGSSYDPMFPHSILGDYNSEKNCVRLNFGTNCTKPANLTVSENGMNQAKVIWDNNSNANSWIVEYSTDSVFSGAIATTVTTDSCLLTGLTPETEYYVRVKADCGATGESYWNTISFTTNPCLFENQCEITYELGDTYGDGWAGNAIKVVDVTSGIVLDSWTIDYGSSATGSLFVCDGREIRFEWVVDVDENETSYNVYDANGIPIFRGVGAFLSPITYTANCASSPCPTPDNITVSNFNGGNALVSWTENGSATAWQLCLDGDEANPISVTENPYTLSGLDTTIFHNVKVRANCGSDYSFWGSPTSFAKVRSTSNWYAYAQRCPNNDNLRNKFICFSAQDPATATAASDQNPYAIAATFVNGEVWFFDDNNTNLYKAPLYNFNKTMGTCDTVASNFDGNNNIASMSYNPVDGRIYYILYTPNQTVKLKSFDPSNLHDVIEIGTFNNYAWSIAIDSNGNAYCTDLTTGNLCQLNLTNATTTPVGNLGFSSTMPYIAFDMITGEMLMGQMNPSNDNGIYLVNPATAEKQLIGYIAGGTGANISGLFMANGSAPIVTCPAPTNLAANSIFETRVTLSWTENGSATEWQACINGDETNPVFIYENPFMLDGLDPETSYSVKVRANCDANGYSQWSDEVSFTTLGIPPYFFIDGADSICPNQTTTLYVNTNMGTDYLWNTGETSQSITVPVGTYSVSVSKNGNVVAYGSFEVKGKQTYNITLNDTICESELPYTWNNLVFNAAGSQSLNLQAANGCDSVVTMTLTVNPTYNVSDAKTICQSELPYSWNNITFNTAGTKEVTLQAANGCDSVVTMILTVSNIYQTTDEKTVCQSALPYVWNGVTFNTAGTKEVTLQAANGCDSVVVMTLTVSNNYQTTDEKTVCQSALPYVWNGVTFNAAGTKEVTLQAANGCDSVVAMTLTVSNNYQTTDEKTVCQSALPYVWNGVTFNAAGTKEVTLQAANGCDSVVAMTLTVNPIYQVTDTKTICESELPYTWNNVVFNAAGTQNVTLQTVNGCDSVVAMTLTVNPIYQVTDTKTICESELPYTWNNVVFNAAGTQNVTLQTVNGCDSVVAMTLTVNPIYQVTDTKTICESELPYTWNNIVFNAAGTQNVTLQTVNGCDSMVAMTLTVNPIYQVTDTKTICESELPYTWNNVVFNAAGTQNVTLRTVNGCDSVVAMTLIVNPTYNVSDIKNVCPSEMPYIWNGITFNAPGTHTVTLATVNGCDSVVTMILSVNQTPITHENRTICESELPYEWNGIVFNTFGANTAILQGENGCDSTVIMTLNVIPSYRITDTRTICQSELPYTWNDVVFNATDTQSVTLQAANGCDSVVTMILVVNPTYNIIETKSVCPSEMPYVWNGVTFSNAGVQVVTLTTANGCDSVVTMMLTVNQTHVTNESRTICQNELPYEWNGVTFDAAGVNTTTLPDANGCDSTVIMTLHVNPAYNINESMTICESELPYTWNGVVFDAAGTQSLNLETVNGCDSIITMTLTVNPTYTVSDAQTICESELPYTWNGVVFDAAGTQNVTLPTVNGCDSVVTMTLTVNTPVSTDLQVTACESYEWNEDTYTESGDYTQTYTAANGCDSVVTLHLTINNSVSTEFSIETSENCYTWNEQTYCQSGDYVQTFSAANGCDSVVTLHLTISVGINSHNLNTSMTVYPNPTSDVINVEFGMDNEQWQPDVLQLFDASGKIVNSVKLSNTYNGSTRTTQIDLSNLSNGIYFLKATKEGQTMAIRKIVKN